MFIQALNNPQNYFQHSSILKTKREANPFIELLQLASHIKAIHCVINPKNNGINGLLDHLKWSPVNLNNMSENSSQFARETWKCKCGYDNHIDIWGCAVCGRDRPR